MYLTVPMSSPSIKTIPLGASLQELLVGPHNLVLNFASSSSYANNPCYFGATIGRIANRVSKATLTLPSATWPLSANNGPSSLHGGPGGWNTKFWSGPVLKLRNGVESVEYTLLSPHLDEGFPGTVEAKATYSASEIDGKVIVDLEYEARLVGDEVEETAVNITNHSYFNLSGKATIEGTVAALGSKLCLPMDAHSVPLIGAKAVEYPGLEEQFVLGAAEPDLDDCFVFGDVEPSKVPLDTRPGELRICAKFYHPDTKVHLVVKSTEPSFQFYTGKYIDVESREDGTPARGKRAGFCVEPGRYVDAANRDEWKNQVVLRKGEVYGSRIVYEAWIGGEEGV